MDHNDIRHMLSEYIDGAVLPADRIAIEEHLKTCEQCSQALKELRQTVTHIRSVEEIDPPAWMTQKIMAQVRVEAKKKSWLRRLFFPLHIKLPLEAIGVLFIAVTAAVIYQNMQPSVKMKASRQQVTDQAPAQGPAVIVKNEEAVSAAPSQRSKDLPQSPGFKALDMKQEYEKPTAPTLQDQAAAPAPPPSEPAKQPAPMVQAEKKQAHVAEAEGTRSLMNKEKADSRMIRDQTAASAGAASGATARAKSFAPAAPMAGAVAADKKIPAIIVQVMDKEAAAKEVEKAIVQVNGAIIRRESPGAKLVFVVTVRTHQVGELKHKLKLLGKIKEQPGETRMQEEQMELRIEIVQR